jgi:hypothetical protein
MPYSINEGNRKKFYQVFTKKDGVRKTALENIRNEKWPSWWFLTTGAKLF